MNIPSNRSSYYSGKLPKSLVLLLAAGLLVGISLPQAPLQASHTIGVASSNASTLNDLIRRIPIQSRMRERELSGLSAVQEQMILHERRMSGEGMPAAVQAQFSANYQAIIGAVVDERVSRELGRGLLDRHRAILEQASGWACLAVPDPAYGENLIELLQAEMLTLQERTLSFCEVPFTARTPLINGHRVWIEEMLVWGTYCRFVSYGELGKIGRLAQRLERFEGYYKRDGILTDRERSELHRRLIEIHRVTLDAFAD